LFNYIITSFPVSFEINFEQVREEKYFDDGKQDKQLNNDNNPQLPAHSHAFKAVIIKKEDPV
jgi:hypothetical protein